MDTHTMQHSSRATTRTGEGPLEKPLGGGFPRPDVFVAAIAESETVGPDETAEI